MDTDAFLEHYGIFGMRWGQRKPEPVVQNNPIQTMYKPSQAPVAPQPVQKNHRLAKAAGALILLGAGITLGVALGNKPVVNKGRSFVTGLMKKKGVAETVAKKLITIPKPVRPTVQQTVKRIVPKSASAQEHARRVEAAYNRWM